MEHPPNTFFAPEPPPFPEPPRSVDLSPLEFILALIAIVAIPALIYTFFFSLRCPPAPFRRRRHPHHPGSSPNSGTTSVSTENPPDKVLVSDVEYKKETHVKDVGSECPVCLSVFADGEEVKQLSACKHSFHASCIDAWLNSHSNCPVCRASVAVNKRPNNNSNGTASRDSDLHQGLPDAASLV